MQLVNLPKSLTTVTPFSKYLAMGLFLLLLFAGFYAGTQYQQTLRQIKNSEAVVMTPTPTPDENLDGKVWVDIDQIGTAINIYYFDNKKLPQNLEALTTYSGLNNFKLNNNPYTGKPYRFTTKSDGSGFILSGTIKDGTEYKKEFPIK